MYRSCMMLVSALTILVVFSGCAKKTMPAVDIAPAEPVAVTPPAEVEKSEPVKVPEQEAQPVEAANVALDANALTTVLFDYDSYQLSPEAMASLKNNAEMLQADPAFKVTIEGHCDERGSDEYNLSLGELRAQAVKTYLASLGVEQDRLTVISYGEERPAVTGSTDTSWAKNRRVEFN